MSLYHQFGNHPDADQLNAFAEHALPEHERLATLVHLADCAECRQIVFLAQQASEDENPVAEITPNQVPWFRRWNLLWPIAAAVACTLVTIVLLHNVQTDHLPQQALQDHQPRVIKSPPETSLSHPPATVAAAPTVTPPSIQPHPSGTHRLAAPSTSVRSNNSVNGDQLISSQTQTNLPISGRNLQTLIPLAPGNASVHGTIAPATSQPALTPAPTAPVGPYNNDQLALAQNAPVTSQKQNFAQHTVTSAPAANFQTQSATVDVSSDTHAIQTENATVTAGVLDASTVSAAPVLNFSLPSKLPAISRISNGHESLGLDAGGGLFVSRNAGVSWQAIAQRWRGKIVKIDLAPLSDTKPLEVKKTAPSEGMRSAATLGAVSHASSAKKRDFVATTDTGEVWISADGYEWRKQ